MSLSLARWSETSRKPTGRRCPHSKTSNPAEIAQAKRFDHQQRITQCSRCMGRRPLQSLTLPLTFRPTQESPQAFFQAALIADFAFPDNKSPPALHLKRFDIHPVARLVPFQLWPQIGRASCRERV